MEEDTDFLDRYENLDDEDHEGNAATNFTKRKDDPEIMDFINEVEMKTKEKFKKSSAHHDSNTAMNLEFENKEEYSDSTTFIPLIY